MHILMPLEGKSVENMRPYTGTPMQAMLLPLTVVLALLLTACTEPVSWAHLLTARITQQYPSYTVQPAANGNLLVERPGKASLPVDVNAIAAFCLRGTRDCNYATDQMLLGLGR